LPRRLFNEVTSAAEVIKHQQIWEGNYVTVHSKTRKKRVWDRRALQEIIRSFHAVKQLGKVVGNVHAPKWNWIICFPNRIKPLTLEPVAVELRVNIIAMYV